MGLVRHGGLVGRYACLFHAAHACLHRCEGMCVLPLLRQPALCPPTHCHPSCRSS